MNGSETFEGERRETVGELLSLLIVAQKMGRRLAYETHGESYNSVRELNELLHQACNTADSIQQAQEKVI